MKRFQTLLIANRGEIAVRIIRAAKQLGLRTVAIYSDADANAIHVRLADVAVRVGTSEPANSYLNIDAILAAARATGAEAIHPGYGFLSERPEFAQACADAGLVFVGPSPESMRMLGSKSQAKAIAVQSEVPIVPGHFAIGATNDELRRAADQIGYPVMLKASAGGGGRGMRIVRDASNFDEELSIATDEALKAFGDGAMMVEKLVERPRHIEVQILADFQGNVATLFERECSLQRRHQKLLEEAPSPYVEAHPELWPALALASRRLIKAAGYVGAGTVEFMVDPVSGAFYFLEVNARLQVEHPVTEAITGLDLVRWQLRIAQGDPLEIDSRLMEGDRSAIAGHAIEARIVAEDPARNFLPSVGKILSWAEPRQIGLRIDTGYGPAAEIPRFYDSLVAKAIVHAPTRESSRNRLVEALEDFHILGIHTNIAFLLDVIQHSDFIRGAIDTGFLGREFGEWTPGPVPPELGAILARSASTGEGEWDRADEFRNVRPS